jgi:hypothetical protein
MSVHCFVVSQCAAPQQRTSSRRLNARRRAICATAKPVDGEPRVLQRARLDAEFRALQAEYEGHPSIHVYSADDYELDPRGLSWQRDMHGRDRAELRAALATREVPEGFNTVPLREDDVLDRESIDGFVERARFVDPQGNREWRDPMPASDFLPLAESEDDCTLHIRAMPSAESATSDVMEAGLLARALPDPYAGLSDREDEAALMSLFLVADAVAEMRAGADERLVYNDATPVPHPETYKRWQDAAKARGGNAVSGESHVLSPAKIRTPYDDVVQQARIAGVGESGAVPTLVNSSTSTVPPLAVNVPMQHKTLADIHFGEWAGVLAVLTLDDYLVRADGENESAGERVANVMSGDGGNPPDGGSGEGGGKYRESRDDCESDDEEILDDAAHDDAAHDDCGTYSEPFCVDVMTVVTGGADRSVKWSMSGDGGLESTLTFAIASETNDSLAPGRAVFDDGSYVSQPVSAQEVTAVFYDEDVEHIRSISGGSPGSSALTVSDEALASIIASADPTPTTETTTGVAELCAMGGDGLRRQRVILCDQGGDLTHIVVLCEVNGTGPEAVASARVFAAERAMLTESLLGVWAGNGTSLHPYFPPYPVAEMKSSVDMSRVASPPEPRSLTYVKEDTTTAPAAMGASVARSVKAGQREKLSKRVVAALRRDAVRLSRCNYVCTEELQGAQAERTAWEKMTRGGLYSPRLGPRAPDYAALALPGGGAVVVSVGKWVPGVRCRVELVQKAEGGVRKRLVGARSAEGVVTGAALLSEVLVESDGIDEEDEDE